MTPDAATRADAHAASGCIVCGGPLRRRFPRDDDDPRFCDAPACRSALGRKATMRPADFEFWIAMQARHARAQAEARRADAALLAQKQAREAAENAHRFDAIEPAREGVARVALPCGPRHLRNLPQSARSIYRDHLTRIITQAICGTEPLEEKMQREASLDATAEDDALGGTLCAVCSGGCCTLGGTTAYLSAATMRRFMALNPRLRPRDVLAAYLDRVPTRGEHDSCVNHGPRGCTLTREMRADICNRYLCKPRKDLQARIKSGDAPAQAVVIVRRQDQWHRDELSMPNDIVATARVSSAGIEWLTQDAGVFARSAKRARPA